MKDVVMLWHSPNANKGEQLQVFSPYLVYYGPVTTLI